MTGTDAAAVAGKLTEAQRGYVLWLRPDERKMGGYDPDCGCAGLIENSGISHPLFGSHYRLTPLGVEVRQHLKEETNA